MSTWGTTNLFDRCKNLKNTKVKVTNSPSQQEVSDSRVSSPASQKSQTGSFITTSRFAKCLEEDLKKELKNKSRQLMEPGKGLFFFDDSPDELGNLLEAAGVENSCKNKTCYVSTVLNQCTNLRPYVSGLLLHECAFNKLNHKDSRSVLQSLLDINIAVGVRIDLDKQVLPSSHGELTTAGLDRPEHDYIRFKEMGVTFVMVQSEFFIDTFTPSDLAVRENAHTLARFASISLSSGLVPVLSLVINKQCLDQEGDEPGVNRQQSELEKILACLVKALADYHVYQEGVIITLNPVFLISQRIEVTELAEISINAINNCIPPALGGVCFAESTSLEDTADILNAINYSTAPKSCPISFALGDHLKEGLVDIWAGGEEENSDLIGKELLQRIQVCSLASMGQLPNDQHTFFVTKIQ